MNPIVLYLIKVILCSGVLLGYYWLALRNKPFHQWNRFYLLACVVLSLAAPLLKININPAYAPAPNKVLRILNVVSTEGEVEVITTSRNAFALTTEQWAWLAYAVISFILFSIAVVNGGRIYRILTSHPKTRINDICFLNTDARGTPFSFFRYIVWNRAIALSSENGQRIFRHEMAHVQQHHTWDKVFLLLILIPFWSNPFFWLMRKELAALHEFAADEKALKSGDAAALAQMILNTTFPQQHFLFTNHLFQSTIKRRIAMFTKLQNPKVSYLSRIIALPVLLIVIASFALKTKPFAASPLAALDKPITVVIDAGHGGKSGAHIEGVYEDDIALAISKKIREQNTNKNIRIVLTRESNEKPDLKSRVQLTSDKKADLFLSVHVNAADPNNQNEMLQSGMEVVVSAKNPPYQKQSELLGSVLVQELGMAYTTQAKLIKMKTGIWVLDANVCPAVLIECGYLTDKKDRDFITQEQNQTLIANKILDAIERYAVLKNSIGSSSVWDTVPKLSYKNKEVEHVTYIKDEKDEVRVDYKDGTKETITAKEAKKANLLDTGSAVLTMFTPPVIVKDTVPADKQASKVKVNAFKGVIVIDGKVFNGTMDELPIQGVDIKSMDVFKDNEEMIKEYGPKAKDGVIRITTKKGAVQIHSYQPDKLGATQVESKPVFSITEKEPGFPTENGGWMAFLQKNLDADVPIKHSAPPGTYKVVVQFIVDEAGKISDITPVTNHGYGMEAEVVRLMKMSPDWVPATQNGQKVTAHKKQTVAFAISEATTEDDKAAADMGKFNGVILLDGKVFNKPMKELRVEADDIASMEVFKGSDQLVKEFGAKAKEGVIKIVTKGTKKS